MNFKILQQIILARPKSFICIFVLCVINIGLFIYDYGYQSPQLSNLQNRWFEKRRLAGGEAAEGTAAVYRQGTSDLAAWRARISPKKEFARFIGDLFETAANNTLKVGAVSYKPTPIKGENLLAYSINVGVTGKYAALKSFIADVERFRDIVVIDTISLSSGKAADESVDLRLQLTAYFRGDES